MKAKPIIIGALALRYPVNQFLIKRFIQWSQVNGILHGPVEISVKRPCKISKRLVLVQRAHGTAFMIATKMWRFHLLLQIAMTGMF